MSLAMRHIKYEITIEYRKEVICMGLLDAEKSTIVTWSKF